VTLQQTWPLTHDGDPLAVALERRGRHLACIGRPRR
jgi:hypothetical protein